MQMPRNSRRHRAKEGTCYELYRMKLCISIGNWHTSITASIINKHAWREFEKHFVSEMLDYNDKLHIYTILTHINSISSAALMLLCYVVYITINEISHFPIKNCIIFSILQCIVCHFNNDSNKIRRDLLHNQQIGIFKIQVMKYPSNRINMTSCHQNWHSDPWEVFLYHQHQQYLSSLSYIQLNQSPRFTCYSKQSNKAQKERKCYYDWHKGNYIKRDRIKLVLIICIASI